MAFFRLATGKGAACGGFRLLVHVLLLCLCAGFSGTARAAGPEPAVAFVRLETGPGWRAPDCDPRLAAHERARVHLEEAGVATRSLVTTSERAKADLRKLAEAGTELVAVLSPELIAVAADVAADAPGTAFLVLTDADAPSSLSTFQARSYEGWYLAGLRAGRAAEGANGPARAGWLAPADEKGRVSPRDMRDLNAFALGARNVRPDMRVLLVRVPVGASREAADAAVARLAKEAGEDGKALLVVPPCLAGTVARVAGGSGVLLPPGPDWNWNNMYGSLLTQIRFGLWRHRAMWYGMKEGVVLFEAPPGAGADPDRGTAAALRRGTASPFAGPVRDAAGRVRIPAGKTAPDEVLRSMDWLAEGIRDIDAGPDSRAAAPSPEL